MNKTTSELEALMADPKIAYVIDGTEAYIKLAKQQYSTGQTKVVEGIEHLDDFTDKNRTLWWLDLSMWPHLSRGMLDQFNDEPLAKPNVTMLWNPQQSVNHTVLRSDGKTAKLRAFTVMGSRVLSLETEMTIEGAGGGMQTLAARIYKEFPGSYELTQDDPRHIGTHRDQSLPPKHKHLVKQNGAAWTEDDIDTIYGMAMSLGLTAWDPIFGAAHKIVRDISQK